jgi:threonine/homoserine/homoserine lactone efflux protein
MIALPGPSVLLTVAHSLSIGWRNALSTVAGETTGIAVQLLVAAIGLTSLLHAVGEAFEWLRPPHALFTSESDNGEAQVNLRTLAR